MPPHDQSGFHEPVELALTHNPNALEQTNCFTPLLRLPAELRNHIFQLSVLKLFSIDILSRNSKRQSPRLLQPSLSRTSRQLRREVLPIFYGGNAFEIDGTRYSRPLPPDNMLIDSPRNPPFSTIERDHDTIAGFETVRGWLHTIGSQNRRFIGEILLCCPKEDAGQILEIARVHLDFGRRCLMESGADLRLSGFEWMGQESVDEICFANACYGAGLKHFRIAVEM